MSKWPKGIAPEEVEQLVKEYYEELWQWLLVEAEEGLPVIDTWMSREDLEDWLKRKRGEFEHTPTSIKHYYHLSRGKANG